MSRTYHNEPALTVVGINNPAVLPGESPRFVLIYTPSGCAVVSSPMLAALRAALDAWEQDNFGVRPDNKTKTEKTKP